MYGYIMKTVKKINGAHVKCWDSDNARDDYMGEGYTGEYPNPLGRFRLYYENRDWDAWFEGNSKPDPVCIVDNWISPNGFYAYLKQTKYQNNAECQDSTTFIMKKMNWVYKVYDNQKCGSSRIAKYNSTTKAQCVNLCRSDTSCEWISYGDGDMLPDYDKGSCILCPSHGLGDRIVQEGFSFWGTPPKCLAPGRYCVP